jgi:hypothetical protein
MSELGKSSNFCSPPGDLMEKIGKSAIQKHWPASSDCVWERVRERA